MEPTTLRETGQRAQHTTNELFRPPVIVIITCSYRWCCGICDSFVIRYRAVHPPLGGRSKPYLLIGGFLCVLRCHLLATEDNKRA